MHRLNGQAQLLVLPGICFVDLCEKQEKYTFMLLQTPNGDLLPVITCRRLKDDPKLFQEITGIGIGRFEKIYKQFEKAWQKTENERLGHPNRHRAIGGGRKYTLPLEDQLLAVIIGIHLRLGPTAMAPLFGLHPSTISRNRTRIVAALRKVDQEVVKTDSCHSMERSKSITDYPELLRRIAPGGTKRMG